MKGKHKEIHIERLTIKLSQDKETVLKAAREKWVIRYKGSSIKLTDNISAETTEARRQWDGIFKVLKEKKKPY